MAHTAPARPGTITGSVIVSTSIGAGASDLFIIACQNGEFDYMVGDEETTADGDNAPAFDLNYFGHFRFWLTGYMPAQSVQTYAGYTNLVSTTNNPFGTTGIDGASMKFHLATSLVLTAPKVNINRIKITYGRTRSVVGLAMVGKTTEAHPTIAAT